ncbi:MAG: DUF4446 family protein [Fimbriimonadaceae bacterium]
MDSLNEIPVLSSAWVIALLILLVVALAVAVIWLLGQVKSIKSRWSSLLEGSDGENLERLLYDHLRQRVALEEDLESLRHRLQSLEQKMPSAKRYLGMMKFDAFEDVGGEQSFSLAVYDEQGNGAVISSIVGRQDCRVYCKQLTGGRASQDLSAEEERAIELAAASRAQARVSS